MTAVRAILAVSLLAAVMVAVAAYARRTPSLTRVEVWNSYEADVRVEHTSYDTAGRVTGTGVGSPGRPGSFMLTRGGQRLRVRVSIQDRPDLEPVELEAGPGDQRCVRVRVARSRLILEPRDPADRVIVPEPLPGSGTE